MGDATEKLLAYQNDPSRFDIPGKDLRADQIAALNERFVERKDAIKLLAHRADEAGITQILSLNDMVPLLFPHTAYKSYPESFLVEEKWDRLSKWLGTISPHAIPAIDTASINDIDDWIDQLQAKGHFISCSSGTTGKSAMLIASEKDMAWSRVDTVNVFAWGSGVEPRQDRKLIGCAPVATVPKNVIISEAQYAAFFDSLDVILSPVTGSPAVPVGEMMTGIEMSRPNTEVFIERSACRPATCGASPS